MLWAALTHRITVRRRTAVLVEAAAALATLSVARQPVRAAYLEASVSGGTSNTGTVAYTGLVGGVTTTEVVTFDGSRRYAQTAQAFSSIAGATTTGLADEATAPTIEVRGVDGGGTPQAAPYDLVTGWPAGISDAPQAWGSNAAGGRTQDALGQAVIAWAEHWAPREGDLVVDDTGRTWEVLGAPKRAGSALSLHWDCRLRRHEG